MMLHPDDGAPPAAGSRPVGDVSGRLPVPGLDTETRVLRRYFFQGTPSTGTMHFDVLIEPGDKIDASTDHLRYRYVDFMTQPGMHSVVNTDNNTVDIGELQHWLEVAKARTRIEAYPLFVVAKEVLQYLLRDELTFTHAAADKLRAQLAAVETRMEQLRATNASAEEALRVQMTVAQEAIAALEGKLEALRNESAEKTAALAKQLKEARAEMAALQATLAELKAQIGTLSAQLLDVQEKIAHAVREAYKPEALLARLQGMLGDGSFEQILELLSWEDKLLFFRLLVNSCDVDQKHSVMREIFGSFIAGELDVQVVADSIKDVEKPKLLQSLLTEFKHEPQKVMESLSDKTEDAKAMMETASAGLVTQAVKLGCQKQVLLDVICADKEAIIKHLLEELGLKSFLREIGVTAETACESLGLEKPEDHVEPPHGEQRGTQTTYFEDKIMVEVEMETIGAVAQRPTVKRHQSELLEFFNGVSQTVAPMSETGIKKVINKIYEKKVLADQVDDREGHRREAMPEFIQDHFIQQYGLKSLAREHMANVVVAVRKYGDPNTEGFDPRVQLFGQLSGILGEENFSTPAVNFMIDLMRRLFVANVVEEALAHADCAVTLDQASTAVALNFESYYSPVPAGLLDDIAEIAIEREIQTNSVETTTIMQIFVDKLFEMVHKAWIVCQANTDQLLMKIFEQHDSESLLELSARTPQSTQHSNPPRARLCVCVCSCVLLACSSAVFYAFAIS